MTRKLRYVELKERLVLRKVGGHGLDYTQPPDRGAAIVLTDEKFELEQSGARLLIRPRPEKHENCPAGLCYSMPMDNVVFDLTAPDATVSALKPRGKDLDAGATKDLADEAGGLKSRRAG